MQTERSAYALIVVGYNRCDSLKRLVGSLQKADYLGDRVDLIFSIDNAGTDTVERYAKTVQWPHGQKIIRTFPQRQGLRAHILQCGDYTELYDAVAVFEDDIFAAPGFYNYMKQAVAFYHGDPAVGGISLYSHRFCENSQKPFTAQKGNYDNYFLQYAQSWGQVWMKDQWRMFRAWYRQNSGDISASPYLPACLRQWPATSWLKYHIAYCILEHKYFVYPYDSLTTNFVEQGQHCKHPSTVYQVPMTYGLKKQYHFCRLGADDSICYDGFFERETGIPQQGIAKEDVVFDINGVRTPDARKRYFVSTQKLDYKILQSYAFQLRPAEMNVLVGIPGEGIYLYDTQQPAHNALRDTALERWYYDTRVESLRYTGQMVLQMAKQRLRDKLAK